MLLPMKGWKKWFLSLGTTLMVMGLASIICFQSVIDLVVKSELQLKEKGTAFEVWEKTRPITMDFYMFNWTNPNDIYDSNTKPKLVEVGPYRFKLIKEKVNVTWNKENNTVTYQNRLKFYYAEDSPGNFSDVVTTFNIAAWAVAQQTKDSNIFIKESAKIALLFSELHVTKTVRELLFEGYEDPLISTINSLSFLTNDNVPDRVGLFYGKNYTAGIDGVLNVHINLDSAYGTLKNWNYNNTNRFYEGRCSEIHGSAGEFFPMNVKPDHITYFLTTLCRALNFKYEQNHTVNGIFTYKYSAGKEVFDNGMLVEENKCYYKGKTLPSGVIEMSACQMGLPVYSSLPHFYHGDSSYINAVEGLLPNKNKHEFYFALEPNFGIIADTVARVQMNLLVQPITGYGLFKNVPEIMFPIFWTENKVPLYDDYCEKVRLFLSLPEINKMISTSVVVLGAIFIGYVIIYSACNDNKITNHKFKKEEVPLTRCL